MTSDIEIETPQDIMSKLSKALVLIAKGDPIVSLRTELKTQFDGIETRFRGIDKATELQHDDLVRVPTQVDRAVDGLKELMLSAIDASSTEIKGLIREVSNVSDEKFLRIDGAFVELNRQTTVLRSTDQLALAAALQTAEKAVNKTELNTAESIKALRLAFDDANKATNAKIDAVTSRLDKGEGNTKGSAETAASQTALTTVEFQRQLSTHGSNQNLIAIATIAVVMLIAAVGWLRPTPLPAHIDVDQHKPVSDNMEPVQKWKILSEAAPVLKFPCLSKPSTYPPCPDAPPLPIIFSGPHTSQRRAR